MSERDIQNSTSLCVGPERSNQKQNSRKDNYYFCLNLRFNYVFLKQSIVFNLIILLASVIPYHYFERVLFDINIAGDISKLFQILLTRKLVKLCVLRTIFLNIARGIYGVRVVSRDKRAGIIEPCHVTSRRPCWCHQLALWGLDSILLLTFPFVFVEKTRSLCYEAQVLHIMSHVNKRRKLITLTLIHLVVISNIHELTYCDKLG